MPFPAGAFHYYREFAGEEVHLRFMEGFETGGISVRHSLETQATAAYAYLHHIVSHWHRYSGGIEHGNRNEAQIVRDELRLSFEP